MRSTCRPKARAKSAAETHKCGVYTTPRSACTHTPVQIRPFRGAQVNMGAKPQIPIVWYIGFFL